MALIHDLTDDHFAVDTLTPSGRFDFSDLDHRLFLAGKMVAVIHDLATVPESQMDTDAIAATARGLLAYLGTIGEIIDALEATPSDRGAVN